MPACDIVVVGASAGGLSALSNLAAQLPGDFPAAVFVVQHVAADAPGMLAEILGRAGLLPVQQAEDEAPIEGGRIYVARPDYHLTLERPAGEGGRMRVERGPRENRARPAIDPLFRSAAAAYGSRVVGVVLSGLLDDGTAGLHAIKRGGGVAMVQDPDEAACPDMPQSALEHVDVDYRLPVAEMGAVLCRLAGAPSRDASHEAPVLSEGANLGGANLEGANPEGAKESERTNESGSRQVPSSKEVAMSTWLNKDEDPQQKGKASALSCPACGGPLWERHEGALRQYRCNIGHAYTPHALLKDQDEATERALSMAMRTLEERARMLAKMTRDAREKGRTRSAEGFEERAEESREHADTIRRLLWRGA